MSAPEWRLNYQNSNSFFHSHRVDFIKIIFKDDIVVEQKNGYSQDL